LNKSKRLFKKINRRLKMFFYRMKLTQYRLLGKKIVHILHIGKTGGSALKEALRTNLTTDNYRIELHNHRFKLKDVPKGDKVVFFLRDPISRFFSGFYSRQREGKPRCYFPWSPKEKKAFNRFKTPQQLAAALSFGNPEARKFAMDAMKSIQHVRSSYWRWLGSEEYFMSRLQDILLIGFKESLEDDFVILKQRLNLDETIELPKDIIKAHKNPENLDYHLDDEARRNLMDWYASDMNCFGLCQEKANQINENSEAQTET